MRRTTSAYLTLLLSVGLLADEKPQPHGMVSLNGLITGSATLDPEHEDQHRLLCSGCEPAAGFQFSSASAGAALFYFATDSEVLQGGLGLEVTRYQWPDNPYFDQETFPEVWIQLAGQTTAWEGWTWRSLAQINIATNSADVPRYLWGQGVIWGRYEWNDKLGLHIGALSLAGLRYGRIFPVVGFDYELPWHWNLRLIFPFEYSLTQQVNEKFRYGIAARTFFGRNSFTSNCTPCFCVNCCQEPKYNRWHKSAYCCPDDCNDACCNPCASCEPVQENYSLQHGYIEYTNFGLEAMVNWWPFFFTELTASIGVAGTGNLKLTDCHDNRPIHRYFNPTGYAQLALNIYF